MGLRETLTLKETLEAATPGPWHAGHPAYSQDADVFNSDDLLVAKAWPGWRNNEESNARLIALAPELAAEVLELRERHREAMALVLDMGEELRSTRERHQRDAFDAGGGPCICGSCRDIAALLARLDQLGKEQR